MYRHPSRGFLSFSASFPPSPLLRIPPLCLSPSCPPSVSSTGHWSEILFCNLLPSPSITSQWAPRIGEATFHSWWCPAVANRHDVSVELFLVNGAVAGGGGAFDVSTPHPSSWLARTLGMRARLRANTGSRSLSSVSRDKQPAWSWEGGSVWHPGQRWLARLSPKQAPLTTGLVNSSPQCREEAHGGPSPSSPHGWWGRPLIFKKYLIHRKTSYMIQINHRFLPPSYVEKSNNRITI